MTGTETGGDHVASSPERFLVHGPRHGDRVMERAARWITSPLLGGARLRRTAAGSLAADRPVSTGRRVVVVGAKDGAGRTALTALLGSTFAARRTDPVLAVDAHHALPTLGWRLGLDSPPMRVVDAPLGGQVGRNLVGVDGVLPRTATGLRLLADARGGRPHLARDLTRSLTRLFGVTVIDTGPGIIEPWVTSVMADAHAIVVCCPAHPEGLWRTVQALDHLRTISRGAALPRSLVVLNDQSPGSDLDQRLARRELEEFGVPVLPLRFDRHIALGATIDVRRVQRRTMDQLFGIAGCALERASTL